MTALRDFFAAHLGECLRAPAGNLRHPYLHPGAGYAGILWDWDAYFCAVGLAPWMEQVRPHVAGCVRNFLDHQRADGSIPYSLTSQSVRQESRPADAPQNSAKPLLAQFALLAGVEAREALGRHVAHWEATQRAACGLFTFRSHRGSGSDNHPAVYGRPFNSSADVFLNSLMVEEYRALAQPAKADALAALVRERMWDPLDGLFYNLDVGAQDAGKVNQAAMWPVPLKFRMWTTVMPLWAGIATKEQAERVVRDHLLNPAEFWSPHGLRSMARNEPGYRIFAGSNPSDWQGPIWVVANYLAWRGLLNYGYEREARQLAGNLVAMLKVDIAARGCLHEYYDPETGNGLTHPGFLNWNTLAVPMEQSL